MTFSIPFLSLLFFSLEPRSTTKTPERMMSFFFPRYRGQKHERRRRFQKGRFLVRAFLAKKSDASGRVYAHTEVFFLSAFSSSFCHRVFSLSLRCVSTPQQIRRRRRRRRRERFFRRQNLPTPLTLSKRCRLPPVFDFESVVSTTTIMYRAYLFIQLIQMS